MMIVGIAGGSGAGKTTFVKHLSAALQTDHLPVLSQDAYYRDNSHLSLEERKLQNYDHPDAIEWALMAHHLQHLQAGNAIDMPDYSMITCTRTDITTRIEPAPVLLVEGILIYTQAMLRDLLHLRIFLDVDDAHRYERVLRRDMKQRGRSEAEVAERYRATVAPMYEAVIHPSRLHAHVLVPGGGKNEPAAQFIAGIIRSL
jgi:uridine kinase